LEFINIYRPTLFKQRFHLKNVYKIKKTLETYKNVTRIKNVKKLFFTFMTVSAI